MKVKQYKTFDIDGHPCFNLPELQAKEPELFEELMNDYPIKDATVIMEIETDKMIDLVALQEKEPELFEELLNDYPSQADKYIFKVIQKEESQHDNTDN